MVFDISIFPSHFPTTKTAIPKFPANPKTFILEKCKTTKDLNQVHASLIKTRLLHHPAAAEPLLEAAALLLPDSTIDYAFSIFRKLEHPDASAYNIMIRGFTKEQSPQKSILLFRQMIEQLVRPDPFTYSGILKAISKLGALKEGEQIHAHVLKSMEKFDRSEFVENSLVYMYASCGQLQSARKVFDEMSERSPVAWSSMFSGYVRCGYWLEVVGLFRKMRGMGIYFNETTLISVFKACGRLGDLELGEWIHEHAVANGLMKNDNLITSLVDMYAKCGRLETARRLFDSMPSKDVIAWSAMISGYSHSDQRREALAIFHEMQRANVKPNEVTMISVLSCCGVLGALETGKWVHSYIKRKKLKLTVNLSTALVDFYAKCGCVDIALELFHAAPSKSVWTWTALIQGLASNGRGETALEYFNLMVEENVEPNEVTFIGVLSACNHAGLVAQGCTYLARMSRDFGIEPKVEHFGCVVDMLGRAGLIEDAYSLITKMPLKPNAVIWRTLLASCRLHKKPEIAEEALKQVARLEPTHSGDYILLADAYASAGRLGDAAKVRDEMKKMGVEKKKSPGCSYIEVGGVVHEFLAEDKGHPEVYEAVHEVMERIKRGGYEPDTMRGRAEAVGEGDKEASVAHHSEKLAMAFGIIRTGEGTTVRVYKNLRMCSDCHNAAKVISSVYRREIVVRDRSRFHHFKDGSCSCHDFW
ncbi:hypothetical protein SASPL_153585 [Salvia splendens]|uniref:DYW domain-containing protein n=1 Tax=Salvia splendens TaxID=180675 RepID=A0A8X8YZ19_SALSN|nr:pentatricopeptide repeat-containing protein At1g08070, chloroplastic-like [Salvia splendens]KAG6384767.1 hypothetical protein SASPL_153585 [Salvia splendens]